jgi:hypothetical protein
MPRISYHIPYLTHSLFPFQALLEEAYLQMLELHCVESEKEAEQLDSTYLSRCHHRYRYLMTRLSLQVVYL